MKPKKPDPFTFSIVPNFIKPDKGLSPLSKLIYGDIHSLQLYKGFCYASNAYFEKLYGVNKSTITKSIRELKELEYILCEYINKNLRRIYITEKRSSTSCQIDDAENSPSIEDLMLNSDHLPSSNNTIKMVKNHQHKRKKTIIKNNTKMEKRSTDVLPLTFSNKDQLESKLLDALFSLYNRYKHFDLDSIISSIDIELGKDSCREDISQLGFKDWLLSVLIEEELTMSDEKISEEDFYSLSEMFLDQFYDVLTD